MPSVPDDSWCELTIGFLSTGPDIDTVRTVFERLIGWTGRLTPTIFHPTKNPAFECKIVCIDEGPKPDFLPVLKVIRTKDGEPDPAHNDTEANPLWVPFDLIRRFDIF